MILILALLVILILRRVRKLLHRKGVVVYIVEQTDLHARLVRYKTDDQRTCTKGMLAIAHNGQVSA